MRTVRLGAGRKLAIISRGPLLMVDANLIKLWIHPQCLNYA